MLKSIGLLAFLLLAAPSLSAQAPAKPPTLVVMLTIDGFPERNLEKFAPQLTGGLARLTKGGAWFTNAHHDHGITETAPGHATLLAGRFPRSTGITANRVGVFDPNSPLIGFSGGPGASPTRFQGTTLVDWLHTKDPKSRALSVSSKDRAAILPIGKSKQQVYWYADEHLIAGGVGLARTTLTVPQSPGSNILQVRVSLPNYNDGTGASVNIPIVTPEAVIRFASPDKVTRARSFEVRGLGYFFNVTDVSELDFSWQVAGVKPAAYNDPTSITVSLPEGSSGRSVPISLSVANPSELFESDSKDISIDFAP